MELLLIGLNFKENLLELKFSSELSSYELLISVNNILKNNLF
jgi:hypothetical protein